MDGRGGRGRTGVPLLAALLVALRLFLPLQPLPASATAPAPHAHPAEGGLAAHAGVEPGAGGPEDGHSAGEHAQTCHFCRLFDPVLPPPDLRQAIASAPVAAGGALAPLRPALPRPGFMRVVIPRAPPATA